MQELKELRRVMRATGSSKADAARALGVSWQTIHRWIRGERRPSPVCPRTRRARASHERAGAD
jgi:DNA-binding transcriptional regulator YiaG